MGPCRLVADTVWKEIESTHSVTEYQYSILNFLFGKNFERATRIVDQKCVKRISGQPSGRSIFQVVGESKRKEEYFCFPEHFCACYSFFYDICKHQLAARLAASLRSCIEVEVSDEELAFLLSKL
ncbi:zinc finger SWIM domain-containing protein 7 isoform X2 [Morus notabilis]|uniref:zinc finger SWIM domain-containing protein 7 isoform X2 n=1 Tax=Morus notabilis TaxID=981085 RepID=UPI000CED707A|nr:zinc finger SWIM domain-containing protein 7 isoform X2 [Morus notabilis]